MEANMVGFIAWSIVGGIFLCLAVYSWFARKPVGFWANTKIPEVTDIKKYNRALSILFCLFGIVLIALGLPLLAGEDSAWVLLSVVGVMLESIAAMAVYTLVIEKKYKGGKQ